MLDANILSYMDIPVDRLKKAHEDVSRLGDGQGGCLRLLHALGCLWFGHPSWEAALLAAPTRNLLTL